MQSPLFRREADVEPGREHGFLCPDGDQEAAVEAGAAGVKPLQPVDGRKAVFGIVEGEKLTHKSFHIASASGIARDGAEFTNVQFIQLFRHDI